MSYPLPLPEPLRAAVRPGTRVLLGLSGGLDSAMALAALQALGCTVLCVTFRNFAQEDPLGAAADPGQEAPQLARAQGAEHFFDDLREEFHEQVISPFVTEYLAARTPNPCVVCNAAVRFPALVRLADEHGCQMVATGHYARIGASAAGAAVLLRGHDPAKDQSYFLHRIDSGLFERIVFPLGWYRKAEVREGAVRLGLPVAGQAESQEVCFLPDDDRSRLFPAGPVGLVQGGDIVDRRGRVLGRHRGLVHYTVGQRRGLKVAAAEPLYVLELEAAAGRLVVGTRDQLRTERVIADRFQRAVTDFPEAGLPAGEVTARIRHRHRGVRVRSWRLVDQRIEVEFAEAAVGVAPGQALVLYQGDVVLGGGRILASSAAERV